MALAMLLMTLAACGLPRSGPTKSEVLDTTGELNSEAFVVDVDNRVTRVTERTLVTGFPNSFLGLSPVAAPDLIRPGDTLTFTIYENVADGLLARGNSGTASLSSLQVDDSGFIFIPYAGRIRAAGNTTERLRQIITERIGTQTPEPQVIVQRAAGDGATVSVVGGGIGAQGVYPLQRSNRRLMEMLATAGGVSAPPEVTRIIVIRGQTKGEVWLEDIYDNPAYDIALRAGDRVLVERDTRTFTILGATGSQGNIPFAMKDLSALEAVAQVGGLDSSSADPTGLFVIRDETPEIARRVLGRNDIRTPQSIIYVLNLTEPNGIPLARDFDIRDGDTIYVTEAPFVQWTKTLNAITGTATSVQRLERTTN
jgi:polysaccharide export outer membrane protein